MKGPSLHYDTRVLRVFRCDACGREVQARGHVTSETCMCSDPPRFMRPLERPRTVSPDVSRFVSPPEPEDLLEVEDADETPYVPHVPVKPPPPARFANRRKLYDDTASSVETDFGDGIVSDPEVDAESGDGLDTAYNGAAETADSGAATFGESQGVENSESNPQQPPGRRRRGRRGGRAHFNPSEKTLPSETPRNETAPKRTERPEIRPAQNPGRTRKSQRINQNTADGSSVEDNISHRGDSGSEATANGANPSGQGDGRKRPRRRGRRRGPRPEGGNA